MKTTGVRQRHGLGWVLLVMLTSAGLWTLAASLLWPGPIITSATAQPLPNLAEDPTQDPYLQASRYVEQGRYRDAIAPYETSLAQARRQNPQQLPYVLGNLAIAYRITGQYLKAVTTNQELIQLLEQNNQQALLPKAWGNLGNVYISLGDYEQAQEAFGQARQWAVKQGNRPGEAFVLASLGTLAAQRGQNVQAIELYNQALKIEIEPQNLALQSSLRLNLGATQHSRGQYSQAKASYQAGLALAEQIGDRKLQAEALGSLGILHDSQRDFTQAQDFLQRSLALFEAIGDRPSASLTLNNLGHAQYAARQFQAAEATLRQALTMLDELRQSLSDLDKVSLFDTQAKTYNLLQQVLVTQGRNADALEVAEWGRARAFADLLNQRLDGGIDAGTTVKPVKIAELQRIARDRQATLVEYSLVPEEDFLHQGKQMGIPEAIYIWVVQPDGQVHHRRADLKPLILQQRPLELLVRASRCFEAATLCKRQLQRQVQAQNRQGSRGFSFKPAQVDGLLEQNVGPDQVSYAGLQQLHQLLIEPIADLLPQDPQQPVIMIPQAELFLVPFPALQDRAGRFLIERHTLLTSPSIQILSLTGKAKARIAQRGKTSPKHKLVVGNPTMPTVQMGAGETPTPLAPLPGSEQEAIAIAQLLKTQPLIGTAAKESVVLQQLPQAHWVHLATHGLMSYGLGRSGPRQMPGAIALARDEAAAGQAIAPNLTPGITLDGLLTSAEIINLRLTAELVVLSACDTGRGDLTGDGVVGLARAWMGAGVPSLVVSLWPVSDESTSVLMQQFYGNLNQGMTKAQALRQASLTTARRYPNPSDWAAFTLLGEAD